MNHIILIGFMGSGKTSVGIRLSYRYKMAFVDTDRAIEQKEGKKIKKIFAKFGEDRFRMLETQCLLRLMEEESGRIISVGGGLPLRDENRELLKQLGTVVYLRVKPETVCQRLRNDKTRPLLRGDDPQGKVRELLDARKHIYAEASDLIIDVDDKSFEEVIGDIDEALRQKLGDKAPVFYKDRKDES